MELGLLKLSSFLAVMATLASFAKTSKGRLIEIFWLTFLRDCELLTYLAVKILSGEISISILPFVVFPKESQTLP